MSLCCFLGQLSCATVLGQQERGSWAVFEESQAGMAVVGTIFQWAFVCVGFEDPLAIFIENRGSGRGVWQPSGRCETGYLLGSPVLVVM